MSRAEQRQTFDGSDTIAGGVDAHVIGVSTPRPKLVQPNPFQKAWLDLYELRQAGHMGAFEYANGGMKLWEKFLKENPEYYIPSDEIALIHRCAHMSARLIGAGKKVTIVSRGPGTKFGEKEGALVHAFKSVGVEIAAVVYIDISKMALTRSVAEGRTLLPDAEHIEVIGDIFDPETKHLYKDHIAGTEVGTCFGVTPMNVYGRHDANTPPLAAIEAHLSGFRKQQRKGSHFIAAYDHNDDRASIEAAYSGQSEFALHMLEYPKHLGIDTTNVEFIVDYNPESRVLAHGFHFQRDVPFVIGDRERTVTAGTKLWFNNSVKPSLEDTMSCYHHSGYEYAKLEEANPVLADNGRFGYHHTIAA